MPNDLTLPDRHIRLFCLAVGITTLLLNGFCLFLIVKHRRIFALNIFVITACLQVLYLLLNVHFNFALIPIIYAEYGGGFCISWVCNTHVIPFWVLFVSLQTRVRSKWTCKQAAYIFLMVNISGLFTLLLFYRHQTLMHAGSYFCLSNSKRSVLSILLIAGVNIVPIIYGAANSMQKGDLLGKILDEVCPMCDWQEAGRNFGVLNARIAQINAAIVLATIAIYGAFAFACGGHLAHVMRQHMRKSSLQGLKFTVTLTQTRQSLIQIIIFGIFLAIPIMLFVLPVFYRDAQTWVLLPEIFLFSLNSFVHSCTLITSTAPFRRYISRKGSFPEKKNQSRFAL